MPKDISLVERQLRKMTLSYRSGLTVVGSPDVIDDRVTLTTTVDGEAQTIIRDEVEHVRNR